MPDGSRLAMLFVDGISQYNVEFVAKMSEVMAVGAMD